jgi:hypothetical protein
VETLLYGMNSSPKKNFANAGAERLYELFREAVGEFDCRWNEDHFDDAVRKLVRVKWPTCHENCGTPCVPVRCDECYLKAELLREGNRHVERWPTPASSCRHLPIESCPSLKAAFAHARGTA